MDKEVTADCCCTWSISMFIWLPRNCMCAASQNNIGPSQLCFDAPPPTWSVFECIVLHYSYSRVTGNPLIIPWSIINLSSKFELCKVGSASISLLGAVSRWCRTEDRVLFHHFPRSALLPFSLAHIIASIIFGCMWHHFHLWAQRCYFIFWCSQSW